VTGETLQTYDAIVFARNLIDQFRPNRQIMADPTHRFEVSSWGIRRYGRACAAIQLKDLLARRWRQRRAPGAQCGGNHEQHQHG
jgi:hypothetical protein